MRILSHCALAALAAILAAPTAAQAQYLAAESTPSTASYSSYYAQEPTQGNYQTGATNHTTSSTFAATAATNTSPQCASCFNDCCCEPYGNWRENTIVWFGGEAYKSLGDFEPPPGLAAGYMDSAGFVGGFNTGFQLIPDSPIRGQVGASYGVYDLKGRDTVSPSSSEQQTFVTAGIYRRSDVLNGDRLSWGLVYDQFWAHQWGLIAGELYVGQVRGLIGWAVDDYNEFGVWGAFRATGDDSVSPDVAPFLAPIQPVRTMNQYNVFWRRYYDFGGQSMLWVGGNDPADIGSWLVGALGQAPLNDYLSLYGNFTFAFPGSATGNVGSNEEEWAFGVGLSYSFGGKADNHSVSGRRGLPLIPVANNGTMLITN